MQGLANFEDSPDLSDLEKLVLHYAVGMTVTPVDVSDELFAELQKHFNDRQLVELTSAIAWENYRARFDHAFGAEAEGFSRAPTARSAGIRNQESGIRAQEQKAAETAALDQPVIQACPHGLQRKLRPTGICSSASSRCRRTSLTETRLSKRCTR